jgi:hypothetical protein
VEAEQANPYTKIRNTHQRKEGKEPEGTYLEPCRRADEARDFKGKIKDDYQRLCAERNLHYYVCGGWEIIRKLFKNCINVQLHK